MLERTSSQRHSRQTRPSIGRHGQNVIANTIAAGSRLAGESRLSLYAPRSLELSSYVWRGKDNPAAARLKAKLAELGIS